MKDLTESQTKIYVAVSEAIKDELVVIGGEIMGAIEKLRIEQRELHSKGDGSVNFDGASLDHGAPAEARDVDLSNAINRWQGLSQSAQGNIARVVKEMQEYLKLGKLPGGKKYKQ